jgi:UDP-N-acetylmuramate dehydrogenase
VTRYLPQWWCPPADPGAVDACAVELVRRGLQVTRERPLGSWTTLGVGGAAAVYVEPRDVAEVGALMEVVGRTDESAVPLLVIGRGSNLLVADSGWPGVALRLGAGLKHYGREGLRVEAGGGTSMPALAAWCAKESLAGLEFAAGIPATVGGSVRMNAGAHGGETADLLVEVDVAVPGDRTPTTVKRDDMGFGYRQSRLPPRSVVVSARWDLLPGDPAAIRQELDELRAWRRATQPLRQRNCGSVFANPPGDSAGRLVEAAGLKGRRRGGAQISDKHANFIVVEPTCRAIDVLQLIADARRAVHEAGGPLLEPEVRVVGDFAEAADGDA